MIEASIMQFRYILHLTFIPKINFVYEKKHTKLERKKSYKVTIFTVSDLSPMFSLRLTDDVKDDRYFFFSEI